MAYKQTPGRDMMSKTGSGIPQVLMSGSPMEQQKKKDPYSGKTRTELNAEIEKFGGENLRRVAAERVAKSDSTSAANNAMKLDAKLSEKMAARIGNEAGNVTRTSQNIPKVIRGTAVESGGVKNDPKNPDAYWRAATLDRDYPIDLLTAFHKSGSPTRQMAKGAFKKPAMTSTTTEPKAAKTPPAKQMKKKKC
jgi:hypothetical protein